MILDALTYLGALWTVVVVAALIFTCWALTRDERRDRPPAAFDTREIIDLARERHRRRGLQALDDGAQERRAHRRLYPDAGPAARRPTDRGGAA